MDLSDYKRPIIPDLKIRQPLYWMAWYFVLTLPMIRGNSSQQPQSRNELVGPMNFRKILRDFLVGRGHIESRLEYKGAILRGNMAMISIAVAITYVLIDFSNKITSGFPYYLGVIVLSFITIALNRRHQFHYANILFLVTINFLIFIFASSDVYRTGIYTFFICISLSALALMGFRKIKYAVLFSALSLVLFLVSYWGKFNLMTPMANDEQAISVYFTINFLIAMTTCVLIVSSLININHHSEAELVKATIELKKSRERNEMVLETVNAGIYEWYPLEQSVFVNATWKKLLGYEENELKDLRVELCYGMLHPDDLARISGIIARHLETRMPYINEIRIQKKSGEYHWFLNSGNTKFNDQSQPLVTIGSIIDINDRKLAEEKILLQNSLLVKANRELDQFVYSVSHDLRAPLSSILGLTHVYEISDDPSEKTSIVKLIGDRANTLDNFIRDILDYSRNARTDLKIRNVKILPLIEEVLSGLQHMAGLDRVKVEINIPNDLEVITDRERICVIVANMITNSVKYSDKEKSSFISICSSIENGRWLLSVEDNGVGIETAHQHRIFEMFYQAHEHAQGSGLGLYIATEAVQRLGGSISVQSEVGKGSIFELAVPLLPTAL